MWTIDGELNAPGIIAQTRTYHWPRPFESLESTESPVVMLALSRQPKTIGRYCPPGRDGRFVGIGGVSFAPARIPMQWRTDGGAVRLLRCELDQARFRALTARRDDWRAEELEASLDIRGTGLGLVLARLLGELNAPGFAARALTEAMGIELTVGLARYFGKVAAGRPGEPVGSLPVGRLTDYIESLETPAPSIGDLAAVCGVSQGYLMRAFKARTGMTIHAYIDQVRLAKARALLGGTDIQVKEIAFRLGFATAANFSTAFHKGAGETPRAFRLRFRRGG